MKPIDQNQNLLTLEEVIEQFLFCNLKFNPTLYDEEFTSFVSFIGWDDSIAGCEVQIALVIDFDKFREPVNIFCKVPADCTNFYSVVNCFETLDEFVEYLNKDYFRIVVSRSDMTVLYTNL